MVILLMMWFLRSCYHLFETIKQDLLLFLCRNTCVRAAQLPWVTFFLTSECLFEYWNKKVPEEIDSEYTDQK